MTGASMLLWLALLDLTQVRAEPDLPKRAVKALDFAVERLAEARRLSAENQPEAALMEAAAVAEGAELAAESLKAAKRNTGNYKKAELRCRDLLRRLATFAQDLPAEDRPKVEPIEKRIQAIQEELLGLIMRRSR